MGLPEYLTHSYLKCPNETISATIEFRDVNYAVILPICPLCVKPITGGGYFQATFGQIRYHFKCYMDSINANEQYRHDAIYECRKTEEERWKRWEFYVASTLDIYEECHNCDHLEPVVDMILNRDGFCNPCQRWGGCIRSESNPCFYDDDPCHYRCRECVDGSSFELDLTGTKEYLLKELKATDDYRANLIQKIEAIEQGES